jgi:hypothetical protein
MTTLTMRFQRGHFAVTGPDIEMHKFKTRREAKDWCAAHYPSSPIKEIGADAVKRATKGEGSTEGEMMVRVVMFSAIFLAATSVVAAAETRDDGGRLGIGQGANSCWAWTRSHRAKAATQDLYTQWVAVSAPFREVTFCASYKCHCFGVKGSRLSWFRG